MHKTITLTLHRQLGVRAYRLVAYICFSFCLRQLIIMLLSKQVDSWLGGKESSHIARIGKSMIAFGVKLGQIPFVFGHRGFHKHLKEETWPSYDVSDPMHLDTRHDRSLDCAPVPLQHRLTRSASLDNLLQWRSSQEVWELGVACLPLPPSFKPSLVLLQRRICCSFSRQAHRSLDFVHDTGQAGHRDRGLECRRGCGRRRECSRASSSRIPGQSPEAAFRQPDV